VLAFELTRYLGQVGLDIRPEILVKRGVRTDREGEPGFARAGGPGQGDEARRLMRTFPELAPC